MPKISDAEKESATLVPLERILSDIDDTESAFNDFRESFHSGDEPGVVRAWELMIDDRGNVGTTKMQTKLGSWPIDAYRLDELCQLIVDQYMTPDQTRMAVRLVGTDPKKSGYVFNKIMMLKRAHKKESSSNGAESTSSIMKMMQEMNERNMQLITRLQAPKEEKDPMMEIQKMMVFAQSMNAPMLTMLQSLLPALAGRPAPAAGADPFANMTGLLDVAERLADMRGGGNEGGGGDDNSFAGILRAIAPLAKPALEALPAIAAMQAARPQPARLPPVGATRAPPPGSVPTGPPNPAAPSVPTAPQTPTIPVQTIQPTDIPSQDAQMLAQLKPQIDSLVQMAEAGSDPIGAADLIFEQVLLDPRLSEDDFEKLASFVDSPTFVNYVIVMNPAARPHAPWFESFKNQIVKRLSEETETIDTPSAQAPIANGQ